MIRPLGQMNLSDEGGVATLHQCTGTLINVKLQRQVSVGGLPTTNYNDKLLSPLFWLQQRTAP